MSVQGHPRLSVAIVGCGPRGLSILERLLIRLSGHTRLREVVIWAIEPVEHGSGRVWRTEQPDWYAANATAAEVTAQSTDTVLPGGPSTLVGWAAREGGSQLSAQDYPARRRYGQYLHDTFRQLCVSAPLGVRVRPVFGTATALIRVGGELRLCIDYGARELRVDKVVLATGHSSLEPDTAHLLLSDHAHRHQSAVCIGPGIAADMPLDEIPSGSTVAVRGLGLTFYDVVRALSVGRGGAFGQSQGRLRYVPSGREPRVIAGSRGGLPFLARAKLTEPAELAPRPVVLTAQRLRELRATAEATRGSAQLDFAAQIEPLIEAELEHAYYRCIVRRQCGDRQADRFTADFIASGKDAVAAHALHGVPPIDMAKLARPFADQTFDSAAMFRHRLLWLLRADVRRAEVGLTRDPVKAASEALRSLRPALPDVVDFGGLLPESQRDFLTRWVPMSFLLSAGPPAAHVDQLVALIEAGVVDVIGPQARFAADEKTGLFTVDSAVVGGPARAAHVLLDARAPGADLRHDRNPLLRQMLADGMISEYVNVDPVSRTTFHTGGLAITRSPYRVIDGRGQSDPDIYAIGVVTQNTRWFTQVGTGRPGRDSPFCRDADAIAQDVLAQEVTPCIRRVPA
jgi:FAD-NAD(P)-binding